jgi:hypothetical protein
MTQCRQLPTQLQIQQQRLKGFQLRPLHARTHTTYSTRDNTQAPKIARETFEQQ